MDTKSEDKYVCSACGKEVSPFDGDHYEVCEPKDTKSETTLITNKGEKKMKPETIMIDEQKYVREDCVKNKEDKLEGMERCIIRSYGAGVFIGYVAEKKPELNGVNIILKHSKRIHYWAGACSLTQLAIDGTNNPDSCRITEALEEQFIANVIEIIPVTKKASKNIDEVKIWKK